MIISELIEKLQAFIKEHGDLPVILNAEYSGLSIELARLDDEDPLYTNIGYNQRLYGSSVVCALEEGPRE
jgi:hypothetical protein